MRTPLKVAQEIILSHSKPLAAIDVPLSEAWNRVLAEDVHSPLSLPPFATSAMDGYAVIASDTLNPPVTLKVVGESQTGSVPPPAMAMGEAVRVTTGAPVPPGADSVVKVEDVEERGDTVTLTRSVVKGDLINTPGQDVAKGDTLLSSGTVLDYRKVALLASVGITRVKVFDQCKVAFFATGDEVMEPGQPLQLGKAYNTNRYIVEGALLREGAKVDYCGILPDDIESQKEALSKVFGKYEVVVTTGAVSKGRYDFLRQTLSHLNVNIHLVSTNIKPGHPLVFGTKGDTIFFGLPGYPSATLVNTVVYLLPAIRRLQGIKPYHCLPQLLPAVAGEPLISREGRTYFLRINLRTEHRRLVAYSAGSQLTSTYLSSALCDGLAVLPEDVGTLSKGTEVEVIPL